MVIFDRDENPLGHNLALVRNVRINWDNQSYFLRGKAQRFYVNAVCVGLFFIIKMIVSLIDDNQCAVFSVACHLF